MKFPRSLALAQNLVIACLFVLVGATAFRAMEPSVSDITAIPEGTDSVQYIERLPWRQQIPTKTTAVHFTLGLNIVHPQSYLFVPDDCVQSIQINGQNVEDAQIPFCDIRGKAIHIGRYVSIGDNAVTVVVENKGGDTGFTVHPAWYSDWVSRVVQLCLVVSALAWGAFFVFRSDQTR
jgi:hypothetical protein